jgi:D-methionine transport system substrate-binding protein
LDAAIINTNYALQAQLRPGTDAIAIESRKNNPYGNVIAVRAPDKDKPGPAIPLKSPIKSSVRPFAIRKQHPSFDSLSDIHKS